MNFTQENNNEEYKDTKRVNRLKKYKKSKFVYYALKHPIIFIRVYEESGLDDESFCQKYEINYMQVWPKMVQVLYNSVPMKIIRMIREEIKNER